MDQREFLSLFRIGEIIDSGGDPSRRNAAQLEILAVDSECVRYRSIRGSFASIFRWFDIDVILQGFDRIDPGSINRTIQPILLDAGLKRNVSTENYLYGFAKAIKMRSSLTDQNTAKQAIEQIGDKLPATTGGLVLSGMERRAIEEQGVTIATSHFLAHGYVVQKKGKPYDLLCTKDARDTLVEVKATQGKASQIILTKNEVELSRNRSAEMQLAIVTGIQLDADGKASGGQLKIISPWLVDDLLLSTLAFTYDLSRHR